MLLFYMYICKQEAQLTGETLLSKRITFTTKIITDSTEIPPEMFFLYDQNLRDALVMELQNSDKGLPYNVYKKSCDCRNKKMISYPKDNQRK